MLRIEIATRHESRPLGLGTDFAVQLTLFGRNAQGILGFDIANPRVAPDGPARIEYPADPNQVHLGFSVTICNRFEMKSYLSIVSFILYEIIVGSSASSLLAQENDDKQPETPVVRIENSRTGTTLILNDLVDSLGQSDVVILGEQHDNDSGHEFQLGVIKGLANSGHSIAITTEQFERDVQGSLNDYLSGRLSEDQFLNDSRPWKNYSEHYRAIIEFAKENKIPVIAGNIPRRIASAVSQGKQPATEDFVFMPRQTNSPKNAYWEKFKASMEGHMGTDDEFKIEKFFASQCLKDDAMAESITDYLAINSHKPKIVVHLCGHFHSDFGLGTAARVMQRRPLTRLSVVTMESLDKANDKPTQASLRARSHFTFWTAKNQNSESVKKEASNN